MKFIDLEVRKVKKFGNFYEIVAIGEIEKSYPGQFYMLKGDWGYDPLLPRPISVMDEDFEKKEISFLIKIVGEGSEKLCRVKRGDIIRGNGPLGRSFPIEEIKKDDRVALIGGGVGVPPLYYALKNLSEKGINVTFFEGAKTKSELLLFDEISSLAKDFEFSTEDGSFGKKGVVTNLIKEEIFDYVFTCGPYLMMKGVFEIFEKTSSKCFVSLEERMACGYGVCLGCAVAIKGDDNSVHFERACIEGPVFNARNVVWA